MAEIKVKTLAEKAMDIFDSIPEGEFSGDKLGELLHINNYNELVVQWNTPTPNSIVICFNDMSCTRITFDSNSILMETGQWMRDPNMKLN